MEWPVRPQLRGQWAPWGQGGELGARGTETAASSLSHLLSPKKSHVPLSPATEWGSAKGRAQTSQVRKPGSAWAVHPTVNPPGAGSRGPLLPQGRGWRAPTEPGHTQAQAHSPGKALTTESGGQGVVLTVLQQERKQAKRALVHGPLVTLTAPGWSGTTPDGPARCEVRTSHEPPWERGQAAWPSFRTSIRTFRPSISPAQGGQLQREPWAGMISQPHCLLQNESMNSIHVTDEPSSQVSGPGTTSCPHTESTHSCRRECRNDSIEWVPEACPPGLPLPAMWELHPFPLSGLESHQVSGLCLASGLTA